LSSLDLAHLPERLLEIAANGHHVDVRFGLMDYGPVDFATERTTEIRPSVVGPSQTVGKFGDWLRRSDVSPSWISAISSVTVSMQSREQPWSARPGQSPKRTGTTRA
jgi:hypothetical protein